MNKIQGAWKFGALCNHVNAAFSMLFVMKIKFLQVVPKCSPKKKCKKGVVFSMITNNSCEVGEERYLPVPYNAMTLKMCATIEHAIFYHTTPSSVVMIS